jgi:hypothetical protein
MGDDWYEWLQKKEHGEDDVDRPLALASGV